MLWAWGKIVNLLLKSGKTIPSQIGTIISSETMIITVLEWGNKFLVSINHFTRNNDLSIKMTFTSFWKLSLSVFCRKSNKIYAKAKSRKQNSENDWSLCKMSIWKSHQKMTASLKDFMNHLKWYKKYRN